MTWNTFLSPSLVTFWDSSDWKLSCFVNCTIFKEFHSYCAAWDHLRMCPQFPGTICHFHSIADLIQWVLFFWLLFCLFICLYLLFFSRLLFISWGFYSCIDFKSFVAIRVLIWWLLLSDNSNMWCVLLWTSVFSLSNCKFSGSVSDGLSLDPQEVRVFLWLLLQQPGSVGYWRTGRVLLLLTGDLRDDSMLFL